MHTTRSRNAWWLAALMSMTLHGCSAKKAEPRTDDIASESRVVRAVQESAGDDGTALSLEEGKMGKNEGGAAGQYAMSGSGADPALAKQQAVDMARSAGVVGSLRNESYDNFRALSGPSPGSINGGLIGESSGSASSGVAPQGGGTGTGYGTIGTGRYGTIGHGAGGYGASGEAHQANTESYKDYGVNKLTAAAEDRVSTFAIDVDTASYSIARRKILEGSVPPPASVRVEEFVNYFKYDYSEPQGDQPLAVHMDAAPSPFKAGRHILRVGVQSRKLANSERKPVNLVFLVDVSGSMASADKLGLAKRSLGILVDNLRDGDQVALVTYAGDVRVVLEPTGLEHKGEIMSAIASLQPGGSTSMGSGIELAYNMAARNLGPDVVSRVIVLSDGDANVGRTSHEEILATISGHVKEGVTLSTIGYGMGNYKDERMEQLANKGNGNYYYIDDLMQARRVFQEQLGSMLEVVAKDVKLQVEFDPEVVSHYRLIGYENRDVADRDFRNDRVDAGEVGAGHSVTALYEVVLASKDATPTAPLGVVRVRAKKPRGEKAAEWIHGFEMANLYPKLDDAPRDFRFAVAVAGAAEILRQSEYASSWSMDKVIALARSAAGQGERQEFVELMGKLQGKIAMAAR